jgi:hypothetical protein
LGVKVKQDAMPLAYTPRKMLLDPTAKHVITIESEHRTMAPGVKAERLALHVKIFFPFFFLSFLMGIRERLVMLMSVCVFCRKRKVYRSMSRSLMKRLSASREPRLANGPHVSESATRSRYIHNHLPLCSIPPICRTAKNTLPDFFLMIQKTTIFFRKENDVSARGFGR